MTEPRPDPAARAPGGLVALVRAGALDPELGGLLWVLVEGGLAVVVAGGPGPGRDEIVRGLRDARPDPTTLGMELAAADDPEPRTTARTFLAAAQAGLGPFATVAAADLEGVYEILERRPIRLSRDELGSLGLVVVLAPTADGHAGSAGVRVGACHWVRPLARDAHGHVQRLGPAVLATWDGRISRWEHFAWGVLPELAARLGVRAGELERDAAARAAAIASAASDDA